MHLDQVFVDSLEISVWEQQGLLVRLCFEEEMPYIKFRNVVESHKKVPINTVVLPPLEAGFKDNTGVQGTSFIANIMVNKSKSSGQDLVTISRAPEQPTMKLNEGAGPSTKTTPTSIGSTSASDVSRVLQLEHNIRFLQDQHTLMLAGLHSEIDTLRNRNRELQFQLIFAKGTPSTPSSPDDETKQKLFSISPKQINATPLQVEILEKELGELRLHVQEIDTKNAAFTLLVEEQHSKLNEYEETIATYQKQQEPQVTPTPTHEQQQFLRKLDDADALIRRLRRENSDLKRDISVATAASVAPTNAAAPQQQITADGSGDSKDGIGGGGGGNGAYAHREYHRDGGGRSGGHNHHHHRGGRYHHRNGGGAANNASNGGGSNYRGNNGENSQQPSSGVTGSDSNNWFPPLYQQPNYWTNSSRSSGANTDLPSPQNPPPTAPSTLPSLQQQQQHNQRRSGHNNNHNNPNYGDGNNGGGGGGHRKYHNRGHHNRSGRGGNGGDKSN